MKIEEWQISNETELDLEGHYKTAYALSLKDQPASEIAKALTFDHLVKDFSATDLHNVIELINSKFVNFGIKGVGLEVGSGPGTFVAALANEPLVQKMYGLDACKPIIEEVMEPVVKFYAEDNGDKIIGVIGEFDKLELSNDSLDFVFDFFSLHHSSNLPVTLKEVSRVLKPGGVLICFDKARQNKLTESDMNKLLDKEYPAEVKTQMGIPVDKLHTRKMNGEFEYRLVDWQNAFEIAGLTKNVHFNIAKIGGMKPVRIVKKVISKLPISVQKNLSALFSRSVHNQLSAQNRIFLDIFPKYPREFSLLIAWKE